jgi:hypothetical protein
MSNLKEVQQVLSRWFSRPWYPFAFSAYPVLALLAKNVGEVKLTAAWRPLWMSLALAGILFGLLSLVLHNQERAAFLSAAWLALIFSYGHVYLLIHGKWKDFNSTRWLLAIWLVLGLLAVVGAAKKSPAPPVLNSIVLGLVILSLGQILFGLRWGGGRRPAAENAPVQALVRPQNPPDVYYFILDMYTRDDLLRQSYAYDNSHFLNELKARGFYVAQCSQSNYTRTELSVASSLNMSYLQELDPAFADPRSKTRLHLWEALRHNAVRYNLEGLGYQTVTFATGLAWSELDDADVFFTPEYSTSLSEFESLFLQTTLARLGHDYGWLDLDRIYGQNFRYRHNLVFHSMEKVANMPGAQFVYVHLIMPHPPFVFGPGGESTNPADFWDEPKVYPPELFKLGYVNQIVFLNTRLLEMLDTILAESETPPIILLQGDHGPWVEPNPQHFFILNAYYLPGHSDQLYPNISPINSFRVIFNNYFGGKYDMLADVTYDSPVPNLYDFSEVKNNCP